MKYLCTVFAVFTPQCQILSGRNDQIRYRARPISLLIVQINYRRRCQECYRFRVIAPARYFVCRSTVDQTHTVGGRCHAVGRVNQADVCCLQLKKINTLTGQHWPVELT